MHALLPLKLRGMPHGGSTTSKIKPLGMRIGPCLGHGGVGAMLDITPAHPTLWQVMGMPTAWPHGCPLVAKLWTQAIPTTKPWACLGLGRGADRPRRCWASP
jgi:hypothetical protein